MHLSPALLIYLSWKECLARWVCSPVVCAWLIEPEPEMKTSNYINAFFLVGGGTIKGYVATTWACSVSPLSSAFLTFSTKYWKASCRNHRELYPNTRLW